MVIDGTLIPSTGSPPTGRSTRAAPQARNEPAGHRVPGRKGPAGLRCPAGSAHHLTAPRIWGTVRQLAAAGLNRPRRQRLHRRLPAPHHPYKGRNKPPSQKARTPGCVPPANAPTPSSNLAHPAQAPLLALARRIPRQSHPRPSSPRDRRMKTLTPQPDPVGQSTCIREASRAPQTFIRYRRVIGVHAGPTRSLGSSQCTAVGTALRRPDPQLLVNRDPTSSHF